MATEKMTHQEQLEIFLAYFERAAQAGGNPLSSIEIETLKIFAAWLDRLAMAEQSDDVLPDTDSAEKTS